MIVNNNSKKLIARAVIGVAMGFSLLAGGSDIRFISHRGESLDAPENTMAAFRLAVERQTAGFECDVYLTADNEIVCLHDLTLERTTDGSGKPGDFTLDELKKLDAGSWKAPQFAGERIPTLSEALSLARDNFEIYVEIKSGTEIMPRLLEVMAAAPEATPARVVFISFNTAVVAAVREQLPAYRAYWLTGITQGNDGMVSPSAASAIATLQTINASGLDAQDHLLVDQAYVNAVKSAGYSFHVWTVNDAARAADFTEMGVDTITTDCGGRLDAVLSGASSVEVPLIHWTFDGGAATNCGSGGAAYDATVFGAVAFTNGIHGGGLRFLGGSEGYASVSHTFGDQGTVAFWCKPERFYNWNSLFDNSVDPNKWEMWTDVNSVVRFRLGSGQGDVYGYRLNDQYNGTNQWYHFALTWNRNAQINHVRLYINGVESQRAQITSWITPGNTFYLGGHTGNTPSESVMDDLRIYETVLTPEQVHSVHAEIASRAPVVHITLDSSLDNIGTGGTRYEATRYGEPDWTTGINDKGRALALDGVDDYVSIPYRLSTSGSVSMWYYIRAPWHDFNTVFDNSANPDNYECWVDKDGALQFRPAGGQFQPRARYALGGNSNRWHHIVGTWDALSSNMVLYVNGVERGRAVNTNGIAWPTAGTYFHIGGGHVNNTNGTGVASDLQIFETPLSPQRVAEVYGELGQRGGLVAYVPFDNTATDVANSNVVTLVGSPMYVKTQGGFLKGLSCGGVGTSDSASISNVLGSSVGTVALWYYARGPWYNYQTIFDSPLHNDYWESWIYEDGRVAFRVSHLPGGGMVQYSLNNLRGPDSWYHIACVWDRAAMQTKLYVDGVLRGTSTLTAAGWVDPGTTINLAGGHKGNTKGNGIWDEVRIYDRALTVDEIAELTVIPPTPPSKGTLMGLR
ncbi:MAG: glycerophosphodiester phosphodiesterase family protein [Kiritimatiellae bacterium]|nr:glycerophosphodiester phosphodiesterase family protein [Kiritimatiellia bacterium]